MKNYYIGIDPSLNSTAISIIDDTIKVIDYYVFSALKVEKNDAHVIHWEIPKDKDANYAMERNVHHVDAVVKIVLDFIKANKDAKFFLGIEGYSMGSQGKVFDLAEYGGLLKNHLWEKVPVDLIIFSPSTVKKIVTGKGNAQKSTVAVTIARKHGIDFSCYRHIEDLYDATAVAICLVELTNNHAFSAQKEDSFFVLRHKALDCKQ